MENKEHLFEKAGLGIAPFHCVDVYKDPVGGSCQFCGIGIKFFCIIQDKNGKQFKVGTDCVLKCDPIAHAEAKKARSALIASLRAEKNSVERKARFDAIKAKQAANLEAFKATNPEEYEFLKAAADYAQKILDLLNSEEYEKANNLPRANSFLSSLYHNIAKWGNLSENQLNAVRRSLAESKKKPSEHVGIVGKRIGFELEILHKHHFENNWGSGTIYIMQDTAGNKVVYKGSAGFEMSVKDADGTVRTYAYAQVGDKVKIIAGVKEHSEYKGEKQTIIQRVKTLDIPTQNINEILKNYPRIEA